MNAVSVVPEQQHSAARIALAALLKEKTMIEGRLRHLSRQSKSFQDTERAKNIAQGRLDDLNAAEASTMAAWSSGETDVAPAFDVKARATLESELKQAIAKADSARSISGTVADSTGRLNERLRQVSRDIDLAKVPILVEIVEPLIDRLEVAAQEVHRRMGEATKAVDFIAATARDLGRLGMPNADIEAVQPQLRAVEKLNERINGAIGNLSWGYRFAHDERWPALIAALSHDPLAEPEVSS